MNELICTIQDPDSFSNTLLVEYINKTSGITLMDKANGETPARIDILFIDTDQVKFNVPIEINPSSQVVVVSSNNKYVHSLFKDQIADYLSKSELTYARFLESIGKVQSKITKMRE